MCEKHALSVVRSSAPPSKCRSHYDRNADDTSQKPSLSSQPQEYEYLQERDRNIARNLALLGELGLLGSSKDLRTAGAGLGAKGWKKQKRPIRYVFFHCCEFCCELLTCSPFVAQLRFLPPPTFRAWRWLWTDFMLNVCIFLNQAYHHVDIILPAQYLPLCTIHLSLPLRLQLSQVLCQCLPPCHLNFPMHMPQPCQMSPCKIRA